jgi:hypothetical protein
MWDRNPRFKKLKKAFLSPQTECKGLKPVIPITQLEGVERFESASERFAETDQPNQPAQRLHKRLERIQNSPSF